MVDQLVTEGAGKIYDVGVIGVVCVMLAIALYFRDKWARTDLKTQETVYRADLKEEREAHDKTTEALRQALLERVADSQAYGKIGETVREQLKASDISIRQFIEFIKERERG